ncbi:lantibiotic dehydratase [Kitasatospora sp. NPDC092948]|uniref:lantibiotic dehydratase n=1 Tax=Kitasatospora sp. NPDC092948 TaxID=3364088 RepID=UPI0037FA63EE
MDGMRTDSGTGFESAGVALLRAAVLPLPTDDGRAPSASPASDDPEHPDRLRAEVELLASEPEFMAAVDLASPVLAAEARRVRAGEPLKPRRLRRLAVSLLKYRLRMTHRATPFGLFAGVAVAGFGTSPAAELGTDHRPVSRPDAGWLDSVLTTLLADPAVLRGGRLVANALRIEREGRLVLLDVYEADGGSQLHHSVGLSPAVRQLLECAAEPVDRSELLARTVERFPRAGEAAVDRAITQLVRTRFLLSDLAPPPECADPLRHMLDRLDGLGHPAAAALRGVQASLAELDAAAPADRGRALTAARERMAALHPSDHLIQTDLALDARVVLPEEVAREAERAADALWRISLIRPGSPHLREYHEAFLERYGTDRAVPLLELLDEGRGLGLPAAYRTAAARPAPHPEADARDRVLGELLLTAVRRTPAGSVPEVRLDERALNDLAGPTERRLPRSLELGAELLADSWDALCAGDFRLVLGGNPGSPLAGATFGRFAHLLGERAADVTAFVRRAGGGAEPGERAATVAYRPRAIRSGNVAVVPQWLPDRIPLGVGPAATEHARDLPVEHLAVHADLDGLRLTDTRSGEPVRPVSYSMLNPAGGHLPHLARFLLELGQEGQDWCLPWNWGAWSTAPAQPRVSYGRTVLAPARWLPDRALTAAVGGPDREAEVARWRERWSVPRHVLLTRADHRIAVDLDQPLHRTVLAEELARPGTAVVERLDADRPGTWLTGPDGPHATELVLPLLAEPKPANRTAPRRPAPRLLPDRAATTHLPGGEWLYAKIYVPQARQDGVLARQLTSITDPARLAEDGVNDWFFLRYADPDPHLRLRFHGKPADLRTALLPRLHDWAEHLRDAGLGGRLVLDTYDPETERYGGPAPHHAATGVFHADSRVVIAQLAAGKAVFGHSGATLAALGVLDLLTALGTPEEALAWLSGEPVRARVGDVDRDTKKTVAALLDPNGRPRPALTPETAGPWAERADALTGLRAATATATTGPTRRANVATSLAHLHCNRLLGPRPDDEALAHAIAREALALRIDRKRHGR